MIWRHETHALSEGRLLQVALPEGYDDSESDYPLVVCHDPQWTFGTTCDAALNLGLARLIPRVIVAGVGWDIDTAKAVLRRRGEAYTPTNAPFPDRVAPKEGGPTPSGGAAAHLAWLRGEVLPLLDSRYRTRPGDRTHVGHSLSGLFGLFTMFTAPDTFSRYLLASPSIWWDDKAILSFEERYAADHGDLAARVFASVGADEEQPGFYPMIQNLRILERALRGRSYPNLDLTVTELADEIHFSTIPGAISRGLRTLFAP